MRRKLLGWLGIAALCGGCASRTAYDRHWNAEPVVTASAVEATPLAGKWQGSWQSNDSDYYFGLAHAIIMPLEAVKLTGGTPGQTYEAHFQLYHFWVFTEEFRVTFTAAAPRDGKVSFYGERIMNPIDGVCRYDGFLQGDKIVTSFNSIKDYGTIVLRRVTAESPDVTGAAWGPSQDNH